MKLTYLVSRMGPYHVARFNKLAEHYSVTAIELWAQEEAYNIPLVASPILFQRITLFETQSAARQSIVMFRRAIHAALSTAQTQVVAIPGWGEPACILALEWAKNNSVPSIVMSDSKHDDVPRHAPLETIKKLLLKTFDSALVAGQLHARYLEKLGFAKEDIFFGYDCVDNEYFRIGSVLARERHGVVREKYSLPPNYFLACARFIDKKNLINLLRGYARYVNLCDKEPWHLVIVGDGPLRGKIQDTVTECGLSNYVRLPGLVQYAELPNYYGCADCFVHLSTTEQWGLVVNEAMASGLPVLVSKTCGCVPELVKEGENGYLVDPADVFQIGDFFYSLWRSPEKLQRMGKKSSELVKNQDLENFSGQFRFAVDKARRNSMAGRGGVIGRMLLVAVSVLLNAKTYVDASRNA